MQILLYAVPIALVLFALLWIVDQVIRIFTEE